MAARKLSVSIAEGAAEYAERRAKELGKSLSSVVTEALENLRREEARREVLKYLGDSGATHAEIDELIASWQR